MRYLFITLAILGIIASSLALREHYRTYGDAPCDINEKWDCGIVNHSQFAVQFGIPVADIGIAGYFLLAVLAFKRYFRLLLAAALIALTFSLYLAHIEASVLGVWCIYCAISLGLISLISLLSLIMVIAQSISKKPADSPS